MLKKFMVGSLAAAMLFSGTAFAADVNVALNNEPISFTNQEPVIVNGRTLVPIRGVFEKAGYNVEWNPQTKTATLSNSENVVVITAGNADFTVNGKVITADVAAQIINGSMMIPLRAIGDGIGGSVEWNPETKTASVNVVPQYMTAYIEDMQKALQPILDIEQALYSDLGLYKNLLTEFALNTSNSGSIDNSLSSLDDLIGEVDIAKLVANMAAYRAAFNESRQALETVNAPEEAKELHAGIIDVLNACENIFDALDKYLNGNMSEEEVNAVVEDAENKLNNFIDSVDEFIYL